MSPIPPPSFAVRTMLAIGLALLLPALAATGLLAQNLIENPEFDSDTAPWVVFGVMSTLEWNSIDHDGCGNASGSALATNLIPGGDTVQIYANCVAGIVPGQTYSFGADLRFPTGQAASGSAKVSATWYDGVPDCGGTALAGGGDSEPVLMTTTPGEWVQSSNDGIVAPPGAQHLQVRIWLYKSPAGGSLELRFDGAHVAPAAGGMFFDGFGTESSCRWSAEVP